MGIGIDLCWCGTSVADSEIIYKNINNVDIKQCSHCKTVFTSPFPTIKKTISEIYDNDTLIKKKPDTWEVYCDYARFNISDFSDYKDKKVLDIGPGGGETLFLLKEKGAQTFALEINPQLINYLRNEGYIVYNNINDVQDNFFDYIFMTMVLEHIQNPIEYLTVIKNKLRPNGIIRINVPYFFGTQRKIFKRHWNAYCPDEHFWFFSLDSLRLLLDKSNLKIQSYRQDSLGKNIDKKGKIRYSGFSSFFNSLDNKSMIRLSKFIGFIDNKTNGRLGDFIRGVWNKTGDQLTVLCQKK
ncbi:MAG TPA: class I SAM-dependent methyltransferase [Spirochaetota bacterium]|nr:class I SAM-dependent methyltransferase [Spirochaetota bacterium]